MKKSLLEIFIFILFCLSLFCGLIGYNHYMERRDTELNKDKYGLKFDDKIKIIYDEEEDENGSLTYIIDDENYYVVYESFYVKNLTNEEIRYSLVGSFTNNNYPKYNNYFCYDYSEATFHEGGGVSHTTSDVNESEFYDVAECFFVNNNLNYNVNEYVSLGANKSHYYKVAVLYKLHNKPFMNIKYSLKENVDTTSYTSITGKIKISNNDVLDGGKISIDGYEATIDKNGDYYFETVPYGYNKITIKDSNGFIVCEDNININEVNDETVILGKNNFNWLDKNSTYGRLNIYIKDTKLNKLEFKMEDVDENCFYAKNNTIYNYKEYYVLNERLYRCPNIVKIPDRINNIKIDTIYQNAFRDKSITSIILSNNIVNIGKYAFLGNDINTLSIPKSVKNIESSAFMKNETSNLYLSNIYVEDVSQKDFNWKNIVGGEYNSSSGIIKNSNGEVKVSIIK